MNTDVKLGRGRSVDDALLEAAVIGLSAEETSERIGGILSPARVRMRTREMLSAGDWLDALEQERAILKLAQKNLAALNKQALSLDSAKVQLSYVREILERLEKRKRAADEDLDRLYQAQARIMSQAIALALEKALFELQKRYPTIEEGELRVVLSESLPEAVAVLSAHNAGEEIEA